MGFYNERLNFLFDGIIVKIGMRGERSMITQERNLK
jgi:hypothetical protein